MEKNEYLEYQMTLARYLNIAIIVTSIIAFVVFKFFDLKFDEIYRYYGMYMMVLWIFRGIALILLILTSIVSATLFKEKVKGTGYLLASSITLFVLSLFGLVIALVNIFLSAFAFGKMKETQQELALKTKMQGEQMYGYYQTNNTLPPIGESINFQNGRVDLVSRSNQMQYGRTSPAEIYGSKTIGTTAVVLEQAVNATIRPEKVNFAIRDYQAVEYFFKVNWWGVTRSPENIYSEIAFQYVPTGEYETLVYYHYVMRNVKATKIVFPIFAVLLGLTGIMLFELSLLAGALVILLSIAIGVLGFFVWSYKRQEKYFHKLVLSRLETMVGVVLQNQ